MGIESVSGWPLVGRENEVRQALAALDDTAEFKGVVLVGEAGVGKSTLARAVAQAVKSRGLTVQFVLGTETSKAVPLAAFYWLMTLHAVREPAVMLSAAQRTLEQEKSLVVVVDDAHLLDPLSATLVHNLAAGGSTRLIVTIRSGNPVPDAVTALWKERLLLRLDINAFTRAQTGELARRVLGDAVETRLIDELHGRTAGNPLMLRGLLSAGRESGALSRTETGWQLHGSLRGDDELHDLLEFRLRSLAPEELEAIEIVATAEVLDWDMLRTVSDADAVARLERRGLIQLVADGSYLMARLNHPVIGEVAIQRAGVVRSRQLNGMLAQHLRKQMQSGERQSRLLDVRTRIQLAQFMIRSDLTPDLDVIIDAAANALRMWNVDCAEELGRFALDHGGGLPAAIVLAEAIGWQGRSAEVEEVLGAFDLDGPDELLTAHGCLRASNLFWCGDVEHARPVLASMRDRVESEAGAGIVTAIEVVFAFFSGDVLTAIESGLALCERDVPPVATAWAAAATCWALALTGRFDDVHRIADVGLRAAALGRSGPLRVVIWLAEVMAWTAAGDYSAAERVWERYAAMPAGAPAVHAAVNAMLGLVDLARGAVPSACSAFQNSLSEMSGGSPFSWLTLVAAWSAQAEGARGNNEAAAAALHSSEQAYGPHTAVYLPELEL
ncbi:MAG: AAA family ATPase, partial [Mycobacterium sp.]